MCDEAVVQAYIAAYQELSDCPQGLESSEAEEIRERYDYLWPLLGDSGQNKIRAWVTSQLQQE